jgi:hypothetical protein
MSETWRIEKDGEFVEDIVAEGPMSLKPRLIELVGADVSWGWSFDDRSNPEPHITRGFTQHKGSKWTAETREN